MRRFLVTGATGFLGGAIVCRLLREGRDVIATGRDRDKLAGLPGLDKNRVLALDLGASDPFDVSRVLEGVTCIIHCAGLSSPWGRRSDFEYSNIRATGNLLAIAKACSVEHVIHISTPAIYFRFEDQLNIAEDWPLPKPVNDYARSKAIAERLVRDSGVPSTIVRPRGIYGDGDTALLPRLIRAANAGPLPRFRNGAAATDITHVDDVVDAVLTIAGAPQMAVGETFNVSGGEAISIEHIVERAARASGLTPRWRNMPLLPALTLVRASEFAARLRPGRPEPRVTTYALGLFAFSQTLDLSKICHHLQWRPRISWEEGFARTFDGASVSGGSA